MVERPTGYMHAPPCAGRMCADAAPLQYLPPVMGGWDVFVCLPSMASCSAAWIDALLAVAM
jgi:hypothetical protein